MVAIRQTYQRPTVPWRGCFQVVLQAAIELRVKKTNGFIGRRMKNQQWLGHRPNQRSKVMGPKIVDHLLFDSVLSPSDRNLARSCGADTWIHMLQ
jgi:hypothetical protein